MTERSSRRRLRLRRKRKDASSSSKDLIGAKRRDIAQDSGSRAWDTAEEVVFESGCCLFEAVLTAIVLFALLSVPAYLLLNRVT